MCFKFYVHAGGGDTAVAAVTGKLEAEAERLAELVAVMEDREEQLVGEVSYLSNYLSINYCIYCISIYYLYYLPRCGESRRPGGWPRRGWR